jgi:Na+/phosphate symporter
MSRSRIVCVVVAMIAAVAAGSVLVDGSSLAADKKAKKKPAVRKAALKRTRKQVKMLDDLYKTAVVLITKHYVTEDSDLPACRQRSDCFVRRHAKERVSRRATARCHGRTVGSEKHA